MKPNLSNSFLNALDDVETEKECPAKFKAIYLDRTVTIPPTDSMKMGQYFEYAATGQTPRDGSIPEAEMTKKGELTAEYGRIYKQAQLCADFLRVNFEEEYDTGVVVETGFKDYKCKGIFDVNYFKEPRVIDLKLSGLIGDKWHDYGWNPETIQFRPKIINQAIFYKYLYYRAFKRETEFYFLVHSSKNDWEFIFWKIEIPLVDVIEKTEKRLQYAIDVLDYRGLMGYEYKPCPEFCHDCPVNCPKRTRFAPVKVISL